MECAEVKISCIIPVYNKERYLVDFFDSILVQTFRSFEMILIDDGSTDESLKVLQEYERRDNRIKVYSLESNMGAGNARNYGFTKSTGQYVIFLDADDIYEPEMLEKSYTCCISKNADICYFNIDGFQDGNFGIRKNFYLTYLPMRILNTYPVLENPSKTTGLFRIIRTISYNKLVRKSIISKNHIFFQNLPNANDVYYAYLVCFFSKRIVFCEDLLGHYRQGHGESITTQKREEYFACAVEAVYRTILDRCYYKESKRFLKEIIGTTYSAYYGKSINASEIKKSLQIFEKEYFIEDNDITKAEKEFYTDLVDRISRLDFKDNYFEILWNHFKDNLVRYLKTIQKKDIRIVVWGAGLNGHRLIQKLKEENIDIHCIVDNNTSIQNTFVEGIIVKDYLDIRATAKVLLITNPSYVNDINRQVDYKEKTIDVISCLNFGVDIDEAF